MQAPFCLNTSRSFGLICKRRRWLQLPKGSTFQIGPIEFNQQCPFYSNCIISVAPIHFSHCFSAFLHVYGKAPWKLEKWPKWQEEWVWGSTISRFGRAPYSATWIAPLGDFNFVWIFRIPDICELKCNAINPLGHARTFACPFSPFLSLIHILLVHFAVR